MQHIDISVSKELPEGSIHRILSALALSMLYAVGYRRVTVDPDLHYTRQIFLNHTLECHRFDSRLLHLCYRATEL